MIDRISFLNSVNGIQYPEMLVNFFDHFVALKQIVEDNGSITVTNCNESIIVFTISFTDKQILQSALDVINSLNGNIIIYNRRINVNVKALTDTNDIVISLN